MQTQSKQNFNENFWSNNNYFPLAGMLVSTGLILFLTWEYGAGLYKLNSRFMLMISLVLIIVTSLAIFWQIGKRLQLLIAKNAELLKAKEQAESAILAKENFINTISHEIRTPLNVILGMTHLIKQGGNEAERDYLEGIDFSGRHLLDIVNNVLDYSKIESGKLELEQIPFSVNVEVKKLVEALDVLAKNKGISLKYDCSGISDQSAIIGDPLRLRQILTNLISNAIKFTSEGHVEVVVDNQILQGKLNYKFCVKDTGPGISPGDIEKIFNVFEQGNPKTSRIYGGSGLGLNIAKMLVEKHRGSLSVDSELGKGSCFSLSIPFERSPILMPIETKPEQKADFVFKGKRILLIEDNKLNQIVASRIISNWNLRVDIAESGREAITKLHETAYDLVLTDIHLGDMTGYEIAKYIRSLPGSLSRLPIVALTATAYNSIEKEVRRNFMDDFLGKPFVPIELKSMLKRHLRYKPHR